MKLDINKSPGRNIEAVAVGFCYIIDGLLMVLSLGFARPRAFFWFVRSSASLVTNRRRRKK